MFLCAQTRRSRIIIVGDMNDDESFIHAERGLWYRLPASRQCGRHKACFSWMCNDQQTILEMDLDMLLLRVRD